jgi:hypothetical protein
LAGVTDHDTLTMIETGATAKRADELQKNPLRIKDSTTLLDIHKHLNPPDNADIFERYMAGTVNGNVEILTKLIAELINEIRK